MKENEFKHKLISKIKEMFPGCIVMKNDAGYIQGIPDITILYKNKWACLECKRSPKASVRPNQKYYAEKMDDMSFARFIDPSNSDEVLDELRRFMGEKEKL